MKLNGHTSTVLLVTALNLGACHSVPHVAYPKNTKVDAEKAKEVDAEKAKEEDSYVWKYGRYARGQIPPEETQPPTKVSEMKEKEKRRTRIGTGQEYCAEVHRGFRGDSNQKMTWGYLTLVLGTAAAATGPIVIATHGDSFGPGEKVAAAATPIVGSLLLWGAVQMFNSAASSSKLGNTAAIAAYGTHPAQDCSALVGTWSLDRADLANAAANQAREINEQRDKLKELEKDVQQLKEDAKTAPEVAPTPVPDPPPAAPPEPPAAKD